MKALTIRQPWAWAILHAGKDIENRDWSTRFRGTIAIHAAKGMTRDEYFYAGCMILDAVQAGNRQSRLEVPPYEQLERGSIIGVADIINCVFAHPSPWFQGVYGFVLANPRAITPIECRGALGFWDVPPEIERQIRLVA